MITHEQLECKIAELHEKMFALQKEIEGVESELVKAKDSEEWPQIDDTYWYIKDNGEVDWTAWNGFPTEYQTLEFGNVFQTEEQARFFVERLKVLAEMRKFAFEPNYTSNEKKCIMNPRIRTIKSLLLSSMTSKIRTERG